MHENIRSLTLIVVKGDLIAAWIDPYIAVILDRGGHVHLHGISEDLLQLLLVILHQVESLLDCLAAITT